MSVPAVARKTFERLQHHAKYMGIVKFVIERLRKLKKVHQRVRFIHEMVDDFNEVVFSSPLVQEMIPCKQGCTACCHTQVSVTEDEAHHLANLVKGGIKIDLARLAIQSNALNSSEAYFKLSYENRKCVFLNELGHCNVYADRPSVCRTNAVLGSAQQCDTRFGIQSTRLVLTPDSDMVIYASFLKAPESGTLPFMLQKILTRKDR